MTAGIGTLPYRRRCPPVCSGGQYLRYAGRSVRYVRRVAIDCGQRWLPGLTPSFFNMEAFMPTSGDSDDSALLVSFERKLQLIRDRVRGVAEGYYTATYLVGRPGTSKSFTVKAELERLAVPHVIHYGPISPRGLFNLLADNSRQIIVLDGVDMLLNHTPTRQISWRRWTVIQNNPGPSPTKRETKITRSSSSEVL